MGILVILSLCYIIGQNHRAQYEVIAIGEMMRAFWERFGGGGRGAS